MPLISAIICSAKKIKNAFSSVMICLTVIFGIFMQLILFTIQVYLVMDLSNKFYYQDEGFVWCWVGVLIGIIYTVTGIFAFIKIYFIDKNKNICPKCNSVLKYNHNSQRIQCEVCGFIPDGNLRKV